MTSETTISLRDLLVNDFPSRYNRQSILAHFASAYQEITGKNVPPIAFARLAQQFTLTFCKVIVLFWELIYVYRFINVELVVMLLRFEYLHSCKKSNNL